MLKAAAHVGVVESLPAPGVTLLLGNDVAGTKVFPNPVVSQVPVTIPATIEVEKQHPEVFTICDVTRSMSGATESLPDVNEEEEEEEVNAESAGDVLPCAEDSSLADMFNSEVPPSLANVTVERLRGFQQTDPKIYPLRRVAVQESECDQEKGKCFYLKNDVLWRRLVGDPLEWRLMMVRGILIKSLFHSNADSSYSRWHTEHPLLAI